MECPACSNKRGNKPDSNRVYTCKRCGAIFSSNIYLGDSYTYVLPYMAKQEVAPEQLRYYDLTCLGSEGIQRRHGWYDPDTKLIHQVG